MKGRSFSCGLQTLGCSTWHLIPQSGIKPGPPALGMPSLSHWTTREVSSTEFLNKEHCEGGGSNVDSLLLISRRFCKVREKFGGRGI